MRIEVDIGKLIDYSITLQQYLFCQFVYQQDIKSYEYYREQYSFITREELDDLLHKEMLGLVNQSGRYNFSNFYIKPGFIAAFIEKPIVSKVNSSVEDWIDEWFELFPKGIKNGAYLIRSDKMGCLNKMQSFVKKYPQYNKDIILKATSDYIDYYRMKNWAYMMLAHYFINKNNVSALASSCEQILDRIEQGQEVNLSIDSYKADSVEDKWTTRL